MEVRPSMKKNFSGGGPPLFSLQSPPKTPWLRPCDEAKAGHEDGCRQLLNDGADYNAGIEDDFDVFSVSK